MGKIAILDFIATLGIFLSLFVMLLPVFLITVLDYSVINLWLFLISIPFGLLIHAMCKGVKQGFKKAFEKEFS